MTGREANDYMGKVYRLPIAKTRRSASFEQGSQALEVSVRIDDWKQAYGRDLFLVVPIAGQGSAWVTLESLRTLREETV